MSAIQNSSNKTEAWSAEAGRRATIAFRLDRTHFKKLSPLDLMIATVDHANISTYSTKIERAVAAAFSIESFEIESEDEAAACKAWLTKKINEVDEIPQSGVGNKARDIINKALKKCEKLLSKKVEKKEDGKTSS